ncbi:MAG: MogA/MoaB family molybdenum cofactor biosynthesis protein [Desulforhabdus sp.]|jgi:molybdenum cofactor synthesis domain-containing protein|nr:MogA/MoaB family molybdenum cofactor biosynthesis protein [Desulforhabdus sp.]
MSAFSDDASIRTVDSFSRTVAIITVSDKGAKGEREDVSGSSLAELLAAGGYQVLYREVVPDQTERISEVLRRYADQERAALIVTTGGTGVAPRDVTPEATLAVVSRTIPGMAEAMRAASLGKTPHAMLSRAVVGIRGSSLIVNLPGSPKGALENLATLLPALPHALDKIQGDPADCG